MYITVLNLKSKALKQYAFGTVQCINSHKKENGMGKMLWFSIPQYDFTA